MKRPAIAIVTGFTKSPLLAATSFAPLRALKQRGIIDRIIALTWDNPDIDAFVAPVAAMDDVELVRVSQPVLTGGPYQTGIIYQNRSLEAALQLVPDDDALIVKLRPDFIFDIEFLEDKITRFDTLCAPSNLSRSFGIDMPPSPFAMKVWIAWIHANQPFMAEDATFIGLKRDVAKLADRRAESRLDVLADKHCGWFAHVLRFALPFLDSYPMFEGYLREFRYFPNDIDYRMKLLTALTSDPFYWYLIIVHAWIVATSFHVDCGETGDLAFYANALNKDADWSSPKSLTMSRPYNNLSTWRAGQKPGGVMPCVSRPYGRLVDDSWQHTLFNAPTLRDLTPDNLRGTLRNVAAYGQGAFAAQEAAFFRRLATIYELNWQNRAA